MLDRILTESNILSFEQNMISEEKGNVTIEKYVREITPAIILIPGVSGNTGEGMSSVLKSIERAVEMKIGSNVSKNGLKMLEERNFNKMTDRRTYFGTGLMNGNIAFNFYF